MSRSFKVSITDEVFATLMESDIDWVVVDQDIVANTATIECDTIDGATQLRTLIPTL